MSKPKYRIVTETGAPCPRCDLPAQEREHLSVGAKQLNQPFYYSKWWSCQNRACPTEVFMRDEYKVMNKNSAARQMKEKQEYSEQLSFLRSI